MQNKMNIKADFIIENIILSNSGKAKECHVNAKLIATALKKKGYKVKLCTGIYSNLPKNIRHSWIEFEDKILETDCKQLRRYDMMMPEEFCAVLDKKKFAHRYKEM